MFQFISEDELPEPDFVGAQDIFLSAPSLRDLTLTHYKFSTPPFLLPSSQLVVYQGSAHCDVHLTILRGVIQSRIHTTPEFLFRVLSVMPIVNREMGGAGMDVFVERLGMRGLEENVEIVDWRETAQLLAAI
ncbi:hypothetical protein FB45DRAFT_1032851 [Roridomyces roridus]|uniref:Uncharacterized protein n=1 Tax=Roridomyces roridus TaxID=1738132 RepID=A0AAD7BGF0_9AGAR|nr:hypothetical protein FB45DRAFT_1032851 [Roridomyces roridus]